MGKGGASFPLGRCGLPKHMYTWRSVSLNPYFVPDSICSFCLRDRRQAINQGCFMGFFFGHCGLPPLPPSRSWIEYTVPRFSFSQLVEMIHTDFQGLPTSCTITVLPVVWNAWQPYRTRLRITGSTCELLLLASCIKFSVRLQWRGPPPLFPL